MNFKTLIAMFVVVPGLAAAQTTVEQRERCATRLSSALLGRAPTAALMTSADPQAQVDAMVASADFQEKFATSTRASTPTPARPSPKTPRTGSPGTCW
jgi:hypothetical protein